MRVEFRCGHIGWQPCCNKNDIIIITANILFAFLTSSISNGLSRNLIFRNSTIICRHTQILVKGKLQNMGHYPRMHHRFYSGSWKENLGS